MERIICLLIGYAFGLFQTAVIYSKAKGIDIRSVGSGNAGTTNTLRVFGVKAALLVFFGDVMKCFIAIHLTVFIFRNSCPDILMLIRLYTACGVILGHNYPFYLQFRGGKGIAATAGLIFSLPLPFFLVGFPVFMITYLTTKYVSLGSLLVYTGFMIELVVLGQIGYFNMTSAQLIELYAIGFFLTCLAFWKHRENIKRLVHGEERKTYLTKKNKV